MVFFPRHVSGLITIYCKIYEELLGTAVSYFFPWVQLFIIFPGVGTITVLAFDCVLTYRVLVVAIANVQFRAVL